MVSTDRSPMQARKQERSRLAWSKSYSCTQLLSSGDRILAGEAEGSSLELAERNEMLPQLERIHDLRQVFVVCAIIPAHNLECK